MDRAAATCPREKVGLVKAWAQMTLRGQYNITTLYAKSRRKKGSAIYRMKTSTVPPVFGLFYFGVGKKTYTEMQRCLSNCTSISLPHWCFFVFKDNPTNRHFDVPGAIMAHNKRHLPSSSFSTNIEEKRIGTDSFFGNSVVGYWFGILQHHRAVKSSDTQEFLVRSTDRQTISYSWIDKWMRLIWEIITVPKFYCIKQ